MANPILGADNASLPAVIPSDYPGTLRTELDGLPLGVMPSGEVGLKVIILNINGGANISMSDLPTADPHVKGAVWNNNGTPTISQG